jgi:citrate synthase
LTTTSAQSNPPADPDFRPGLEGVIAFESEIAEPDKEGGALRYRGVDIDDLVGKVSFGQVWGLLVDNEFEPGLPPAEPFPLPVHSGDIRVDVQSALASSPRSGVSSRCSTSTPSRPATTWPGPR